MTKRKAIKVLAFVLVLFALLALAGYIVNELEHNDPTDPNYEGDRVLIDAASSTEGGRDFHFDPGKNLTFDSLFGNADGNGANLLADDSSVFTVGEIDGTFDSPSDIESLKNYTEDKFYNEDQGLRSANFIPIEELSSVKGNWVVFGAKFEEPINGVEENYGYIGKSDTNSEYIVIIDSRTNNDDQETARDIINSIRVVD